MPTLACFWLWGSPFSAFGMERHSHRSKIVPGRTFRLLQYTLMEAHTRVHLWFWNQCIKIRQNSGPLLQQEGHSRAYIHTNAYTEHTCKCTYKVYIHTYAYNNGPSPQQGGHYTAYVHTDIHTQRTYLPTYIQQSCFTTENSCTKDTTQRWSAGNRSGATVGQT
jgi:hypothetical protein